MRSWVACLMLFLLVAVASSVSAVRTKVSPVAVAREASLPDYAIQPVPVRDVHVSGGLWGGRLETSRSVTLPFALRQNEETGRVKNFELAANPGSAPFCTRYAFDDSDVLKVFEGAAYHLAQRRDPALEARLEQLAAKIAAAQEPDGYLYTARTINPKAPLEMAGKERWSNLQWSHELYNLGTLYEAAVAYYQATGRRSLLEVALRSADFLVKEFGAGARRNVPGHQEVELGLVRLARLTGERKYLDLARFFLDQRGRADGRALFGDYAQDHIPVLEQREAVGHSVRALYMYAAMADVTAMTGQGDLGEAGDRLWDDVVGRKLYLTGGVGAAGAWEGFGAPYQLPNGTAYAETCASIANVFWNQRLFQRHADAKYIDVLERTLYNGVLAGVSLSGDRFFYPNPLADFGQHERSPWFNCACCPSSIARFIPAMPGYIYAVSPDTLFVNLFVESTAEAHVPCAAGSAECNQPVALEQVTSYPWNGSVSLRVKPARPRQLTLRVRIPGWARNQPVPGNLYRYTDAPPAAPTLRVNGTVVPMALDHGYAVVRRVWDGTEKVELTLPLAPRRVTAHDAVKADAGMVAVERGPVVYAAEWPDNGGRVSNLVLPDASRLRVEARPGLLNGVSVITGKGSAYRLASGRPVGRPQPITLVPYYAWAHRGKGEMAVWLARDARHTRPVPEPSLASTSKATASAGTGLDGLNDQVTPENSDDHSTRYFHWWPVKGTREWVQYDFAKATRVSEMAVYWFDDTGEGDCRVPAGWKAFYREGGQWRPLQPRGSYGTAKDAYNRVRFAPVVTDAVRIEVQLPEKFSSGIQEWSVR